MAVLEKTVNEVFASAWEVAVRENPILLAQHHSEVLIARTRQKITELLAQGCSISESRSRIIKDLLDPHSPLYQNPH